MDFCDRHQVITGATISLLFVAIFIMWTEYDADSLHRMVKEDGPIESLSAIFFGFSSICFIVIARRSEFLKNKDRPRYFFTISWAVLMFVFMREEISWGQRIFNIATPEMLKDINLQAETNIHNIVYLHTFFGGTYRYLSIMMLTTGLLLSIFAMSTYGKRLVQRFAFPVSPLGYAPLFVGAYVYGKYYFPMIANDADEVREFLMAVGMLCFAMNGAVSPCTLFRTCNSNANEP